MFVGSGVDLLVLLLLRGSRRWAFVFTGAPHGEGQVMLRFVKVHFGCLSWHPYTMNTTLTLELGTCESAHSGPFCRLQTTGL